MSVDESATAPAHEFSRIAIEAIADPFERLRVIMKRLLDPGGCPWDREQTHASLKQYLIEESYEVCEAIDDGDMDALSEELGDVGLQVVFHAELAERSGSFTIEDVYSKICKKLLDRHPHVFGEVEANDAEAVLKNWEMLKRDEKKAKADEKGNPSHSILDGVPRALPSLQRALSLQEKASRVGFDWSSREGVEDKVREEIAELLESIGNESPAEIEEELGDLLFSLVNWARFLKVRPEEALARTCEKFSKRFRFIEEAAREKGENLSDMTLEQLDSLWEQAKRV